MKNIFFHLNKKYNIDSLILLICVTILPNPHDNNVANRILVKVLLASKIC